VFRFEGGAVADDKRDVPRPFDVRTVEYLLKLMSEHDLAEIDLKEGDQRIRLRKGSAIPPAFYPAQHSVTPVTHTAPSMAQAPAHTPQASNPNSPTVTPASPPPATAKNLIEIKSELVGTYYSKPDPKKPDFVSVGSKVTPKTVVCMVEAMKIYNEITAGCTGTIAEICVKGGDYVEFGTVLFRVEPS
jgi:acetyl-CoA carboxylase biotin carboxyl carrier protein